MSFYSYKNCTSENCPGVVSDGGRGIREKVCVQVKKVYDSCMQQQQLSKVCVTVNDMVPTCECEGNVPFAPPICFESCRSAGYAGNIRNLIIDRLCDRPGFARVRCAVDIPLDVLFTDGCCREGVGHGIVTVNKDVLLCVPDDSIVPFTMEALVSAICVSGRYCSGNTFELTVCVTVILKVIAEVEMLIPSYGFCAVPPCEEFAESVCDEFFSLPIFPQSVCAENSASGSTGTSCCGTGSVSGCGNSGCGTAVCGSAACIKSCGPRSCRTCR